MPGIEGLDLDAPGDTKPVAGSLTLIIGTAAAAAAKPP